MRLAAWYRDVTTGHLEGVSALGTETVHRRSAGRGVPLPECKRGGTGDGACGRVESGGVGGWSLVHVEGWSVVVWEGGVWCMWKGGVWWCGRVGVSHTPLHYTHAQGGVEE